MSRKIVPSDITLKQALSLAISVLSFELESPQVSPIPENWEVELKGSICKLREVHKLVSTNNLAPINTAYSKPKTAAWGKPKQV